MSVGSIEARSQQTVRSLLDMRGQLDALQQQIGSGKKAASYAGLGLDAGLTIGLRGQLSTLESYRSTMGVVGTNLSLAQTVLGGLSDVANTVKHSLLAPYADVGGGTGAQQAARGQLGQILDALNTRTGDRYLFSGRSLDTPAVETAAHILDGDGPRAGLSRLVAERSAADRGADGLGRLVVPAPSGASVSLAEDVAGSPFGMKLAGLQSTIAGAALSGPAGTPPQVSIDLTAATPAPGDNVAITFTLARWNEHDAQAHRERGGDAGARRVRHRPRRGYNGVQSARCACGGGRHDGANQPARGFRGGGRHRLFRRRSRQSAPAGRRAALRNRNGLRGGNGRRHRHLVHRGSLSGCAAWLGGGAHRCVEHRFVWHARERERPPCARAEHRRSRNRGHPAEFRRKLERLCGARFRASGPGYRGGAERKRSKTSGAILRARRPPSPPRARGKHRRAGCSAVISIRSKGCPARRSRRASSPCKRSFRPRYRPPRSSFK